MCCVENSIGSMPDEQHQLDQALDNLFQEGTTTETNSENSTEYEEDPNPFDQYMNRGNFLRQLRLLALADEAERAASMNIPSQYPSAMEGEEEKKDCDDDGYPSASTANDEVDDVVDIISSTGEKILRYESFLAHQRYFDDVKHCDIKYMDFGNMFNSVGESCGSLVVEQNKRLGKGGFCWDAGFVLGEHVIANEAEWNTESSMTSVVDLGSGTGLSGLMIAKAAECHVTITDLPEFEELMRSNVDRNFNHGCEVSTDTPRGLGGKGVVTSRTLRWGVEEDYCGAPYDVVIGADIVASLYDPFALAQTLHALSGPKTKIYISGKSRLDKPHEEFDVELSRMFRTVKKITNPDTRMRNPSVFIIFAEGKI